MRKSRRQLVNRIIEGTALALVALNLGVFFGVYRPLGDKLNAAIRRHEQLRQSIRNQQLRVDLLQKFVAALPQAGKQLDDFTAHRIPSRREAYSTAAHLIHKLADASGVKVSTTIYRLDTGHHDPLERLTLEINVQGPYGSLLKFAHALETANDFILVHDFNFGAGDENGALALRLGVDLYLTP